MDRDTGEEIQARVREAAARGTPLRITGGGSKNFHGRARAGEILSVAQHRGIVNYEAKELVITARAGTPLAEIEQILALQNQHLPFEPPHFGPAATLGGAIATGLSGPARPYRGAARDFVLGCRIINGRGEMLRFGGEVMKNVAGYDVSRLMCGALGTLGVLLEISLKVLPRPRAEITVCQEMNTEQALARMNAWAGQALPLSAACHDGARLFARLSGVEAAVRAAQRQLGGEEMKDSAGFWNLVREQQHEFFRRADTGTLWRLSVSPAACLSLDAGATFIDWGGAQRWLKSNASHDTVRAAARDGGGHATLWRGETADGERFAPLAPGLAALHRRIKNAFDPHGILNPGGMYAAW